LFLPKGDGFRGRR